MTEINGNSALPVGVLQIGEGNFLRAFADVLIDDMNTNGIFNGSIVICQPRGASKRELFAKQNCVYNVITRGISGSREVEEVKKITSVKKYLSIPEDSDEFLKTAHCDTLRVVISNTTEAGIAFDGNDLLSNFQNGTFPAKLTAFLYERYSFFNADKSKGLLILPVELIENNADRLSECVKKYALAWNVEKKFINWLEESCIFANTLVDRIVTGKPDSRLLEKLDIDDALADVCGPYIFWGIEAGDIARELFPVDKISDNVIFTENISPYKKRKVRILNGAHTMSVCTAFLCGKNTVLEMMRDEVLLSFVKRGIFDEILPLLDEISGAEQFARDTIERFSNVFLEHKLLDISLNCVAKFRARNLDTLLEYTNKYGKPPMLICFGLAALIKFYDCEKSDGKFYGMRDNTRYEIRDDIEVLEFMSEAHKNKLETVRTVLGNVGFWGTDLNLIEGLTDTIDNLYLKICSDGISNALAEVLDYE